MSEKSLKTIITMVIVDNIATGIITISGRFRNLLNVKLLFYKYVTIERLHV